MFLGVGKTSAVRTICNVDEPSGSRNLPSTVGCDVEVRVSPSSPRWRQILLSSSFRTKQQAVSLLHAFLPVLIFPVLFARVLHFCLPPSSSASPPQLASRGQQWFFAELYDVGCHHAYEDARTVFYENADGKISRMK